MSNVLDQTVIHILQAGVSIFDAKRMIEEATGAEVYIVDAFGTRFLLKTFIDGVSFLLQLDVDARGIVVEVSWERQVVRGEVFYEDHWIRDETEMMIRSLYHGIKYPLIGGDIK